MYALGYCHRLTVSADEKKIKHSREYLPDCGHIQYFIGLRGKGSIVLTVFVCTLKVRASRSRETRMKHSLASRRFVPRRRPSGQAFNTDYNKRVNSAMNSRNFSFQMWSVLRKIRCRLSILISAPHFRILI